MANRFVAIEELAKDVERSARKVAKQLRMSEKKTDEFAAQMKMLMVGRL